MTQLDHGNRQEAHFGVRAPSCIGLCGLGLLTVALLGCGNHSHPTTVAIHGRATLDRGEWPAAGKLFFLPLAPANGLPRRPATAAFDTSGSFSTPTSWTEKDGIVPGRYKVFVECWKVPPTRTGPPPVGYTTPKYQSGATSDLEVEVDESSNGKPFEWDFPSHG